MATTFVTLNVFDRSGRRQKGDGVGDILLAPLAGGLQKFDMTFSERTPIS